jgi:hypothetical protein
MADPLDRGRYVHSTEEFGSGGRTHVVIPVDPSEVEAVADYCDFCYAPGPIPSTVVCEPFAMDVYVPSTNADGTPGMARSYQNYSSLWAACEPCATLIRRRRWSALTKRVINAMEGRHSLRSKPEREFLRRGIGELYARVEAHFVTVRKAKFSDHLEQTYIRES